VIRRRRFAEVVARQLDLFEREHGDLLAAAAEAERAYDRAPREEAEERYGDYTDLVDEGAEELADLRDAYAATLEPDAAQEYGRAFARAAARRFKGFARDL
jgi:hypothetical protein